MAHIDIVIPVYNQAKKLKSCLKSIFRQTFKDFTVTIVDDGSTDGLDHVLAEVGLPQENFHVIHQKNSGANAARNRGARGARGEFLLFCDADIVMKRQMLATMLEALKKNNNASYAYSSFRFGLKTFRLWKFDAQKLKQMPYIHTTSLMRTKHFCGFDENIKRLQDWDLFLTMLKKGYTGVWIPKILFRVKPGGTMSSWMPKFFIEHAKKSKRVTAYDKAVAAVKQKHGLL